MIQAILTYQNMGNGRICGATVGADGTGTYAVMFEAESVGKADIAARKYIDRLRGLTHIKEVHLILNEEYFCGKVIETVVVK